MPTAAALGIGPIGIEEAERQGAAEELVGLQLDVLVEDPGWLDLGLGDAEDLVGRIGQAVRAVLRRLATDGHQLARWPASGAELCVVLADDPAIRVLNRDYRGLDKATDVLSFPMADAWTPDGVADQPLPLGDVILARQTIAADAAAGERRLDDHLTHLVVHGVLHLHGYDHETEADARIMESLEREILGAFGIGDPYADTPDRPDRPGPARSPA